MATPVTIKDDKNRVAKVLDGGLVVSNVPAPANVDDTLTAPYVAFMTPTGRGGDEDLTLDGSTTSIDAYIEAEAGLDIYIKEIKVLIDDNAALNLADFGAISAGLTNGLVPFFLNENIRIDFAERPLLTNFDVLRVGSKSPSLGSDNTAFRIQGAKGGGSDYSYLGVWDMTNTSPGGLGVRLRAGSGQRLGVQINDDLTSLVAFEVLCIGYRRFV